MLDPREDDIMIKKNGYDIPITKDKYIHIEQWKKKKWIRDTYMMRYYWFANANAFIRRKLGFYYYD